jgi:hypothetical protein
MKTQFIFIVQDEKNEKPTYTPDENLNDDILD